jgi:hypothetical protein
MKKWLSIFVLLVSINLISAASLSELLNGIDQSTILFFGIFIISFMLLFFSLKKIFKGDTTTSGIISIALSFMIVYGINKSGLSMENFFFDLGISGNIMEIVYTIAPLLIIAGIIFTVVKLKKDSLLVIGGLLIIASFFIYEKTISIVIGAILIIVRIFLGKSDGSLLRKIGKNKWHYGNPTD